MGALTRPVAYKLYMRVPIYFDHVRWPRNDPAELRAGVKITTVRLGIEPRVIIP